MDNKIKSMQQTFSGRPFCLNVPPLLVSSYVSNAREIKRQKYEAVKPGEIPKKGA